MVYVFVAGWGCVCSGFGVLSCIFMLLRCIVTFGGLVG